MVLAQRQHAQTDIHWCNSIPSFPVLQEAQFSAVYSFRVGIHGKPTTIQRISIPFISKADKPLMDCIASWHLPQKERKYTAVFQFKWGWTGLMVHSDNFSVKIPIRKVERPNP